MKITLVRGPEPMPPETILGHIRGFLFGLFDGWSDTDKRGWRKLWKRLMKLEAGEFAEIEFVMPRSSPYHRRHMKIEGDLFAAQEKFSDFEIFRDWLKVGAGWVVWCAGPRGGVVPIPRSISYAKADQAEFEEFHAKVIEFLRGPHAAPFLWKHLGESANGMMNEILEGFRE